MMSAEEAQVLVAMCVMRLATSAGVLPAHMSLHCWRHILSASLWPCSKLLSMTAKSIADGQPLRLFKKWLVVKALSPMESI